MKLRYVMVAILLFLCTGIGWGSWKKGLVHGHTTFSDGDRPPNIYVLMCKSTGYDFFIVTDHFEKIDIQKRAEDALMKWYGFDNYIKAFSEISDPVSVIGTEVVDGDSHTLMIGGLPNRSSILLTVAAHPHDSRYPFNKSKSVNGIEFFNDGDGYQKTLQWYLDLSRSQDIFVTAGCDAHVGVTDGDRTKRATFTDVKGVLNPENIVQAMREGRTYAAQYGCYLKDINYMPAFSYYQADRPKFSFVVAFSKGVTSSKAINLYYDGHKYHIATIDSGQKELRIEYEDAFARKGRHTYAIEVEACLVTSPIRIDVKVDRNEALDPRFFGTWANDKIETTFICNSDGTGLYRAPGKEMSFRWYKIPVDSVTGVGPDMQFTMSICQTGEIQVSELAKTGRMLRQYLVSRR